MTAFDENSFEILNFSDDAFDIGSTAKGMPAISGRRPVTRKISARSISIALSGEEKAYPTYQFSRRQFIERPKHNPFTGL